MNRSRLFRNLTAASESSRSEKHRTAAARIATNPGFGTPRNQGNCRSRLVGAERTVGSPERLGLAEDAHQLRRIEAPCIRHRAWRLEPEMIRKMSLACSCRGSCGYLAGIGTIEVADSVVGALRRHTDRYQEKIGHHRQTKGRIGVHRTENAPTPVKASWVAELVQAGPELSAGRTDSVQRAGSTAGSRVEELGRLQIVSMES